MVESELPRVGLWGPSGYQTNRAQIAVYGPSGSAVASFDAIDPGMFFEADYKDGGVSACTCHQRCSIALLLSLASQTLTH